ncbi:hypothetical protein IHE49_13090 [Rhodanobacter sp. 7MK24]|uniref:hypothetical protein n=1 Tax=Rhodanobacter sp. 7MK24 TaxID=2775922 RepID=UPI00177C8A50|nr:hypothetical protein [Rhodanobacter sp. 7MK24]MBD8881417.1 hypothetical protein [Rhodanobacter sp. 7MK24]
MHIEPQNTRLESSRDFAKHYLMIVLSILTALGLEAWIEHAHRAHAAAASSARIEAEIRTNLDLTEKSLQQDSAQLQRLATIRDAIAADLRAHTPDETIRQHILALTRDNFDLDLNFPQLRHEAWDVAVADQSASWIDHEHMQRYSVAYASQRESVSLLNEDTALIMNGSGMVNTIADLDTGEVQPRDFLHTISQMRALLGQTTQNLRHFEDTLKAALPPAGNGPVQQAGHA